MSHQIQGRRGRGVLLSGTTVAMHKCTGLQSQHFSSEITQGDLRARKGMCWFGSPLLSFCLELLYFWPLGISDTLLLAIIRDWQRLAPRTDGRQEAASPHQRSLQFPKCSQATQAQAGAEEGVPAISPSSAPVLVWLQAELGLRKGLKN